jgi:hypothetical protein
MRNNYESEDAHDELLNAASSCLRALSRGIPYLLMVAAFVYVMESALGAPYTLTCKSVPAEKPIRSVKVRPPMMSNSESKEASAVAPEVPLLKANPVRED